MPLNKRARSQQKSAEKGDHNGKQVPTDLDRNRVERTQIEKTEKMLEELRAYVLYVGKDLFEHSRVAYTYHELLIDELEGSLTEESLTYSSFIRSALQQLHSTIEDLTLFSTVTVSKNYDSSVSIEDVLRLLTHEFSGRSTTRKISIETENLPIMKANLEYLNHLFSKLLDNSIKFNKADTANIMISARQEADCWRFCVEDNGIGIEERYFESAFLPLKRCHDSNDYSGSGMGLAICRRIVESLSGEIWIERSSSNGTAVCFTLAST